MIDSRLIEYTESLLSLEQRLQILRDIQIKELEDLRKAWEQESINQSFTANSLPEILIRHSKELEDATSAYYSRFEKIESQESLIFNNSLFTFPVES